MSWIGRARATLLDTLTLQLLRRRLRREHAAVVEPGVTELCIEGFMRSGNSFAVRSFQYSNSETRLAHHMHCSGHMRRCLRLDVPVVALIREPLSAISSAMVFMKHRDPDEALLRYLKINRWVRDHAGSLLIVDFELTIGDFSRVIERINERFGTSYATLGPPEVARAAVFETISGQFDDESDRISKLPLPVAKRDELKTGLQPRIVGHRRFDEVESLYREVRSRAERLV